MAYLTVHDVEEKLSKYSPYTFEIPDSLFHQFTRRFRHRSVIRLSWRVRHVHLHVASRDIPTDSLVTETGLFFFFFHPLPRVSKSLSDIFHRLSSSFFIPFIFPPILRFIFSLVFCLFFLFQFEDRYFGRHCLATFIFFFSFLSSFLFFFPSLFTFYRSSRFNAS